LNDDWSDGEKTLRKHRFLILAGALSAFLLAGAGKSQYEKPKKEPPGKTVFSWPRGKKGAVSLTFDDARPSQIENGLPLFKKYGIKATSYVSLPAVEQQIAGWKQAIAGGHEIGNHTMTHPCTGNYPAFKDRALEEMTLGRMAGEIDDASQAIFRLLGVRPRTFAYPCGQTFVGRGRDVASFVPLVAERFLAGRKWLSEDSNDPAFCDLTQLLSSESDGKTFAELKTLVDMALAEGRWLILTGHEIGGGGFQTTSASTLEELCRYAEDPRTGAWIDTVASIGDYILSERRSLSGSGPSDLSTEGVLSRDPDQPLERRVEDLIGRMTLEEKVGQMNMPCVYEPALGAEISDKMSGCRRFAEGTQIEGFGPGGGFFTLPNTILHEGPRQQAEFLNELQRIALEKTRLGIPLLITEEGTHGLMCPGATIFPEGPALGSTWNLDLISRVYAAVAEEARAIGVHQIFTLVVEPIRDPRLGRNEEAYSEDPFVCARYAETIVRAVQGDDVNAADKTVAGLCHYPGQSQPVSGLERGAMEISDRLLWEVFLPPWEAGIKRAAALGVMATYPAIDGLPAHASERILTGILREEFGFDGLVLSEGGGIGTLVYEGLAPTQKEAGRLALRAGVDVGISYESGYMRDLIAGVKEGSVPMDHIDRAVRRILRQKFRLGLFENARVDPERAERIVHSREHQDLALQAAREGIVLLKNDSRLLPLRKDIKSIAVIGPNADHPRNQLGDYVASRVLQDIETVLDGIKALAAPGTEVRYVKGCDVIDGGINEINIAREAAAAAEAAVVVVGENEWQTEGGKGTSGEGFDAATLELTGLQEELVRAVVATGTPTIVVLINGRPLATRFVAQHVPAIIEAWVCGEKGGRAVAEVLFGDFNPSGKLPVTVPRHAGQLPVYYNAKRSKAYWLKEGWGHSYVDIDPEPLYPFGHGLSYTTFEYSRLQLSRDRVDPDGSIEISVNIKNKGDRFGQEVVQLYLQDVISSVSRPPLELRGFSKVGLEPGRSQTVKFRLGPEDLALYNRWLEREVEPGAFKVLVGSSSEDIRLSGRFFVVED
jgi:beta-glucosidase